MRGWEGVGQLGQLAHFFSPLFKVTEANPATSSSHREVDRGDDGTFSENRERCSHAGPVKSHLHETSLAQYRPSTVVIGPA